MSNRDRPARRAGTRIRRPAPIAPPVAAQPVLAPIETTPSFKHKAYAALKDAIVAMDIYRSRDDIRLDERKLAQDFGISRTPVREAMAQLESEGFVRLVPRRGIYVVRKTKREVIEMITVWAALESMAARLITQVASDEEIAGLRKMFATFENGRLRAHLDEYSDVNIEFHQTFDEIRPIADAMEQGGRKAAARAVSDEVFEKVKPIAGTPDECIARIQEYRDAGCTHIMLEVWGEEREQQLKLFGEAVLPHFRSASATSR